MKLIKGLYNEAVCYADTLEESAEEQIRTVCDQQEYAGCRIRIMPDVHAGTGCTIGTTMTIQGKIPPSMVGVDIGCGMEAVRIDQREIDFDELDHLIRSKIPSGTSVRGHAHPLAAEAGLDKLRCADAINMNRAVLSLGTLGGGNHFIELDRGEDGAVWIVVHSGSRYLGRQTADFYQDAGWRKLCEKHRGQTEAVIEQLKTEGRSEEIEAVIRSFPELPQIPAKLAYVEGPLFDDYIHDMRIVQKFAVLNRKAMADVILNGMGWTESDRFTTIHNYIDTEHMILRKGSVSAQRGERLLIPINMRDGALVCLGKGNEEWNCSAPHGAGRLLSRSQAKDQLSLEEYRQTMSGIYTTCVSQKTLDESPMAYKGKEEIMGLIEPTAEILEVIKPIYNFKASE